MCRTIDTRHRQKRSTLRIAMTHSHQLKHQTYINSPAEFVNIFLLVSTALMRPYTFDSFATISFNSFTSFTCRNILIKHFATTSNSKHFHLVCSLHRDERLFPFCVSREKEQSRGETIIIIKSLSFYNLHLNFLLRFRFATNGLSLGSLRSSKYFWPHYIIILGVYCAQYAQHIHYTSTTVCIQKAKRPCTAPTLYRSLNRKAEEKNE